MCFNSYLASIAEQMTVLKVEVCPLFEDFLGCEAGVDNWWDNIMLALGASQTLVPALCHEIDSKCAAPSSSSGVSKSWDCKACKQRMQDLERAMTSPYIQETEILDYLKGPAFCLDPSQTNDAPVCGTFLDVFMGPAWDCLVPKIGSSSEWICENVYGLDGC